MDHKISRTQRLSNTNKTESIEVSDSGDNSVNERDYPVFDNENEEIILEPLEQNPYAVSYTCLLLPKLGSHYLLGDVADRIQVVLKQISASFGWSLEFLTIKPDYLQWVFRVPLSTSTTYVMHVVRRQTSLQLFADFPRFKRENQSDDFWAPGYLIFWGAQPHPVEVIQRYILQTRRHQGIKVDE